MSLELEVVSVGEAAVTEQGCGYADEGEKVFCFAFVATVEPTAASKRGHGSLDDPPVASETL